jgi:hypothetical protein
LICNTVPTKPTERGVYGSQKHTTEGIITTTAATIESSFRPRVQWDLVKRKQFGNCLKVLRNYREICLLTNAFNKFSDICSSSRPLRTRRERLSMMKDQFNNLTRRHEEKMDSLSYHAV